MLLYVKKKKIKYTIYNDNTMYQFMLFVVVLKMYMILFKKLIKYRFKSKNINYFSETNLKKI